MSNKGSFGLLKRRLKRFILFVSSVRLQLPFIIRIKIHHPFNAVFVSKHAKIGTQRLSDIGNSICPPAERPLKSLSASSLLSALITILLLFSFSFVRPIISGTSLAIKILLPIGKAMCIILFASWVVNGNSAPQEYNCEDPKFHDSQLFFSATEMLFRL